MAGILIDFQRGSFLFLNASERPNPTILSPWLRSNSDQCVVQVAVYKFYQQSGEYIARVHPIDESSGEILSEESPEKQGSFSSLSQRPEN
ncbi:hypothetical protein TURU_044484 [Turdus rufiventris]|nr:hypothetical protein TURU_044484 [Turdus rufiventris]